MSSGTTEDERSTKVVYFWGQIVYVQWLYDCIKNKKIISKLDYRLIDEDLKKVFIPLNQCGLQFVLRDYGIINKYGEELYVEARINKGLKLALHYILFSSHATICRNYENNFSHINWVYDRVSGCGFVKGFENLCNSVGRAGSKPWCHHFREAPITPKIVRSL